MRLSPDASTVNMIFTNDQQVHIPIIDGRDIQEMAKELNVTEWARIFVRESAMSGDFRVTAQNALDQLEVDSGGRLCRCRISSSHS